MQTFNYSYRNQDGKITKATIDATDRKKALFCLRGQGISVLDICEKNSAHKSHYSFSENIFKKLFTNRLIKNDIQEDSNSSHQKGINKNQSTKKLSSNFKGECIGLKLLKRIFELHKSGMQIGDAMRIIQSRIKDSTLKALSKSIWRDLSEGITLAKALAKRPYFFSPSVSHVIEAGEATGNLTPVLEKVIQYLEEKILIRKKMKASMAYPAFISVIAFLVVIFFLTVLLPQIQSMLEQLGGEMTWSAKLLIEGSGLMIAIGPFLLITTIFLIIFINSWKKTEVGRKIIDTWTLKLPILGNIYYYSYLYQTGNLISTLMHNGINTTETLELTEKTINNTYIKEKFKLARNQINEGASISNAFRNHNLMPEIALDILSVGENSGEISKTIEEITEGFRDELSQKLNRLTTIVSSLALGFAFSLVGLIAIGIVTSVFEVSKTLSI